MTMKARLNLSQANPEAYQAMRTLSTYSKNSGLGPTLIELINMRVSQINGCAFCLAMHFADARKNGESEARLHLLPAWRETPLYTERERAALAWAEALTHIGPEAAPDSLYEEVRRHFSEEEMVKLSLAVAVINSWNRLMIGFRVPPQVAAEKPR
jgi:AhpD family alkylhydroperoxidase